MSDAEADVSTALAELESCLSGRKRIPTALQDELIRLAGTVGSPSWVSSSKVWDGDTIEYVFLTNTGYSVTIRR